MNYKKQMELKADPIKLAMEEILNPKINRIHFSDWIEEKRELGKKKFNKPISRNKRRMAIRRKQLFGS